MSSDKPSPAGVAIPLLVWPLALAALGALLAHGAKATVMKPLLLGCVEFGLVIGVIHLLIVRIAHWRRDFSASLSGKIRR